MNRSAMRGWLWLAAGAVLAVVMPSVARAQGVVAGSSAGVAPRGEQDVADSHGWVVVEGETSALRQMRSWLVLHVPPRHAIHAEGVSRGGTDGSVRQIFPAVQENPVALAAWGDELFIISETSSLFPQAQRQVASVRVVRTEVGDYWASEPTQRLQSRPGLAGGGEILGAVGTAAGPTVLVARDGAPGTSPGLWLRVLYEGAWRDVVLADDLRRLVEREDVLPTNEASGKRWWRLVATAEDVEIWSCKGGSVRARVWRVRGIASAVHRAVDASDSGVVEADHAKDEGRRISLRERRRMQRERSVEKDEQAQLKSVRSLEWIGEDVDLPGEAAAIVSPPRIMDVAGRWILVGWRSQGEVVVLERIGPGWRTLWEGAVPSQAGVIAMPGCGRLLFSWPTGLFNSAGYGLQFVEVSTYTGRVMYEGPAISASPVSATDLRFLAVFLMGASAAVLLFVLKSEASDKSFHVPDGTALAEGWRRGFAAMIDFGMALAVAAEFRGVDLGEAMSLSGWLTGKGMPVMVMGLGIACVVCTVFESLFGRSLGKLMAGCEVVDVSAGAGLHVADGADEGLARPTLSRSLLRNAIKWMLPPVGVFMVLDAAGRHPGDVLAKTAVVCWLPDDENDDG